MIVCGIVIPSWRAVFMLTTKGCIGRLRENRKPEDAMASWSLRSKNRRCDNAARRQEEAPTIEV